MPDIKSLAAALAFAALPLFAQGDPFLTGLEAFRRGDFRGAERDFRQTSEPRAAVFLALTLAATSRCKQAEPVLESTFTGATSDILKLCGMALAQCRISANRFDEAAPVVQKLREARPDDPDILYLAARLQMRQWNDTIYQLYRRAPSSFRVNQISGEVLETQGRFADAVAEFHKAIDKSPATIGLHYRLGRALLMTSHEPVVINDALAEFQKELALNPYDSVAHYQVAQILILQNDTTKAAASLARAVELDPNFTEALVALGKLHQRKKEHDSAIALFRRAVALAPASETAHYSLMMGYRDAGRVEMARHEKAELDKLQKAPEGEFTEFLRKLGDAPKK